MFKIPGSKLHYCFCDGEPSYHRNNMLKYQSGHIYLNTHFFVILEKKQIPAKLATAQNKINSFTYSSFV